jgi:hypothetical protein
MTWVLRTNGDPAALVPIAQRHVREIDANLPLFQVRTMEEVAAQSVERRKWTMSLLGIFAFLALALSAAGIYGVMAHLVSLRTPEIGVRLTLGAKPGAVMRQILREGAVQAVIGLVAGGDARAEDDPVRRGADGSDHARDRRRFTDGGGLVSRDRPRMACHAGRSGHGVTRRIASYLAAKQ